MSSASLESYYIGIDVGTGSVRASLVNKLGKVVAASTQETKTWRDPFDNRVFEQSTADIWNATGTVIKACLKASSVDPFAVKGLGFDATCSLAVTDFEGEPVVVTKGVRLGQHGERNIILWADHRAEKEADLINGTGSVVLDYVGGKMSLEMEIPKILWLKNNMDPALFSKCQFFDLPDFLTYQATKDTARSCCRMAEGFLPENWLQELSDRDYAQVGVREGEEVLVAGMPVGEGLSNKAAEELGLVPGTPVGSALIDALDGHCCCKYKENGKLSSVIPSLEESGHLLAAVAGTSTCHIVQSPEGIFVNGVWGPYKDPILSGWWMNEGGQSSLDRFVEYYHPHALIRPDRNSLCHPADRFFLQETLDRLRIEQGVDNLTELTKDLHLYPDFHGNRSPIADPRMRGSIIGMELDNSLIDLAKQYHATLLAIALQTRHIVDTLNNSGHKVASIYMSGGQAKNAELMQLFADVQRGAVVLGAAMLGRFAAEAGTRGKEGQAQRLWDIMVEMTPPGDMVSPSCTPREKKLLEAKYKIFLETIEVQKRWRKEMEDACK
ncbi:hypothetical protein BDZ97DRAFT_1808098 [Flammula alnicola]|nr:hypothetical protein BDZ97DRAFT_1808098 [Flammula alnicola]